MGYYGEDWDECDKHHRLYPCSECRIEVERREQQKRHEESVARQRNRLKIAPWRSSELSRESQ